MSCKKQFSTTMDQNWEGWSTMKKCQVFLWAGLILLFLSSCGVKAPETPTQEGNSIVISTFTAAPVNSPVPSEILASTAEPTPNLKTTGRLPGLSAVNVTINLEGQEFTCTQVKKVAGHYERTCLKGLPSTSLFQVVISGTEPFVVDFIRTSVRQNENPDNKIAAEFLSLMAALPYDGATPEDARAWVESTIPSLSGKPEAAEEKMFGEVKYKLYGPPTALTLEMGELP
jgi:hypothetical protein